MESLIMENRWADFSFEAAVSCFSVSKGQLIAWGGVGGRSFSEESIFRNAPFRFIINYGSTKGGRRVYRESGK